MIAAWLLLAAMPLECRVVAPSRPLGSATSTSGQVVAEVLRSRTQEGGWLSWAPRWTTSPDALVLQATLPENDREAFEKALAELWRAPGEKDWQDAGAAFARSDRALRFDPDALARKMLFENVHPSRGFERLPKNPTTWCSGDRPPAPAPAWNTRKALRGSRVVVDRPGLRRPSIVAGWLLEPEQAQSPHMPWLALAMQSKLRRDLVPGSHVTARHEGAWLLVQVHPPAGQAAKTLRSLVEAEKDTTLPSLKLTQATLGALQATASRDRRSRADRAAERVSAGVQAPALPSAAQLQAELKTLLKSGALSWVVVLSLDQAALARLSGLGGQRQIVVVPWL